MAGRQPSGIRAAALAGFLGLSLLGLQPAIARDRSYAEATTVEEVTTEDLAGDPSREIKVEIYKIAPGVSLPWHIHPDAQELVYVLSGPFTVEVEDKGATELETGDHFYLAPNLVHRGINPSASNTAILHVTRIKPKAAPLVKEVTP